MPLARPPRPHAKLALGAWGDGAPAPELTDTVKRLLRDALGVAAPGRALPDPAAIALPEIRLSDGELSSLVALIGDEHVGTGRAARLAHTRGRSTPDLLRLRAGDAMTAPDAVVSPGSHDEVVAVLQLCTRARVAVMPFGGGTSVVGGLEPAARHFNGLIALDLHRLDALVALDDVSHLAVLQPGLRGPETEALLARHGYTLGHFPQSFEYATLGGFAATRSSGQASAGYGRFDDMVMALQAATPVGTVRAGRAPRSAAGPDLRQLLLGSEGALGVITELTLQVRPAPAHRVYEGWRFDSFSDGLAAVRRLAQDGPLPAVVRLSDEAETALELAAAGKLGAGSAGGAGGAGGAGSAGGAASAGALAIVGFEGSDGEVQRSRDSVAQVLRTGGAEPDADAGVRWEHQRFRGPYLRDSLLDAGALVETLETACFWSSLPDVYARVAAAVRDELNAQGTPAAVLCHVSHVYGTGASLYFTVACAALPDPVEQWRRAKRAASEAILAAGATITHHHGVGRDHREHYAREIGELGVRTLAAVKRELDPAGILNPGVLLS